MSDAEETREVAANWRDYLRDTQESLKVFSWVWRTLISAEAKRYAKYATVFILLAMGISMAAPFIMGKLIDGLVGREGQLIIMMMVAYIGCKIVARIFQMYYDRFREKAINHDMADVDVRLTRLFLEKSLGQHMREDGALSGPNLEKGRARVFEIESLLLFDGLPSMIEIVVSFVLICALSLTSGAIMFLLLLIYLVWLVVQNRRILDESMDIDRDYRRLMRHRFERWDAVERVKTNAMELDEVSYLNRELHGVMGRETSFWLTIVNINTLRGILNILLAGSVICYGVWLVWTNVWTIGLLMPLASWTDEFRKRLWMIGGIERRLNRAMPSVKAMKDALTKEPEVQDIPGATVLKKEPVKVVFEGVSHCYPGTKDAEPSPVLSDINMVINPGEKVALIGESGAGKTTIMRLLLRYFDPTSGSITINGEDLRHVQLRSWVGLTAFIPQEATIFDGTLRENFLYGLSSERREIVTDEVLLELMKMVRLRESRFVDGLDTLVGRRGIKLSGGEKQRAMIISAFVRDPSFLVVDEATSSLDSTTEKEVQHALKKVLEASTSALIITHRLPTVRHLCGKFIVLRPASELKEGESQIEATARSFEELYAMSPTFRRLADDQGVVIGVPGVKAGDYKPVIGGDWWNL